jgi:DNA-binding transcriptional ArsR family regulator
VPETAWAALNDPTRRAVLALLWERPHDVGQLANRLKLSQPTTSKHLRVLRQCGLVQVAAVAQRRVYTLDPTPLIELDTWLAPYREFWNQRLDALGDHLDHITLADATKETA